MEIGSVRPVVTGVTQPVPRAPAASEHGVRTELPPRATVTETARVEQSAVRPPSAGDQPDAAAQVFVQATASRRPAPPEPHPGPPSAPPAVGSAPTQVDSRTDVDPTTRDLVFRKIDVQSGDVVEQVPAEALLRMRQAIQSMTDGGRAGKSADHAAAYDMMA